MEENKEIKFIARHYRKGLFEVEPALRRIHPTIRRWWTPARIAAVSAIVVVMSATAAIIVRNTYFKDEITPQQQVKTTEAPVVAIIRVIDFEETPLPLVVEKIKETYGVEVIGVPENAEDYKLSLHYEGSAADLLDTINDILETEMQVKK